MRVRRGRREGLGPAISSLEMSKALSMSMTYVNARHLGLLLLDRLYLHGSGVVHLLQGQELAAGDHGEPGFEAEGLRHGDGGLAGAGMSGKETARILPPMPMAMEASCRCRASQCREATTSKVR